MLVNATEHSSSTENVKVGIVLFYSFVHGMKKVSLHFAFFLNYLSWFCCRKSGWAWVLLICLILVSNILLDVYIFGTFCVQSKHLWNCKLWEITDDLKIWSHEMKAVLLRSMATKRSSIAHTVLFLLCRWKTGFLPHQKIMFTICSELTFFPCKTVVLGSLEGTWADNIRK